MKIIAINSSHRGDQGHTHFLIDRLFKGAAEAGADVEEIILANLKINRCLSCGTCNTEEHHLKCVFDEKDDVRSVFNKMATADIIVYATPIYIFTITGLLKILLERLYATGDVFDLRMTESGLFFHHVDRDICSKPMAVLICCDNMEKETPKNAISFFRTYAKFHDAPLVGMLVRNAGRFAGHGKDPEAVNRSPKLAEAYQAFEEAGRELATNGRVSQSTEKKAGQNILPIPPVMRLLKNFRPVKRKMVEKARLVSTYKKGDI